MPHTHELFEAASRHIPGGVNSPVRAFKGVGGEPMFFKRGEGARMISESDRSYIDYVGSWGPLILGHADPRVIRAVQETAAQGLSFGTPTVLETRMADKVCDLVPSMEMVRMVNSGTEATMSAIRLARGYTGRDKIVKFEGNFHGHVDSLLVKAGSGALTFGSPSSPGVPASLAEHTLTLTYNDADGVRELFEHMGGQIAGIIVEPVAGNMNCVPPEPGFLETLREVCDAHGSVLIFDEVMTGFRVALGGAQQRYGITPDLTCLGKVVGGGMPVGAFGGRRAIMEQLSPLGPVYQAGTLAGNPVTMAAGLATLEQIEEPGFHERLENRARELAEGLEERARAHGIAMTTNVVGGMLGIFFTEDEQVTRYHQVVNSNLDRFRLFFHGMLNRGIYLAPAPFEACFLSSAHGDAEIRETLEAADATLAELG